MEKEDKEMLEKILGKETLNEIRDEIKRFNIGVDL